MHPALRRSAVAFFSDGTRTFPLVYGSKVVKPNGTRARSAISLYWCWHL